MVLLRYLRRGRPSSAHRELFLRERAPAGILKPTAVTEVFQQAVRRSGLPIVFHGPHTLRHSYAVSLLRRGVGLKTLGDLLGHRTAESTCTYLRLATEDLRDVALAAPRAVVRGQR
jgi:site-specific recombinase XerD